MFEENREVFEKATEKIDKHIASSKTHPNFISFLSLITAALSFIFLIKNNLALASPFFILAVIFDWLDGKLARATGQVTKLGAYLDTIIDRYVEAFVLFGFFFLSLPKIILPSYLWISLALFGSLITTYAKSAREEKGLKKPKNNIELAGRAERVILIVLAMFFGIISVWLSAYFLILLAIISNVAALSRIFSAIKENYKD